MSDSREIQIEISERETIEAANCGDFALYNTLLSYRISAQGIQPDPRIEDIAKVREMYRPDPIYSAEKITGFEWRACVGCSDCYRTGKLVCDQCNSGKIAVKNRKIKCRACKGSARMTCDVCNGSGYLESQDPDMEIIATNINGYIARIDVPDIRAGCVSSPGVTHRNKRSGNE
ncbi:MAG: hypothetical protein GY862_07645 [Gammaproteobacteria bacterium]|nr:hypothetical protein [Gammaproteobacteria bacterium]